jgi:hypothetical protein
VKKSLLRVLLFLKTQCQQLQVARLLLVMGQLMVQLSVRQPLLQELQAGGVMTRVAGIFGQPLTYVPSARSKL